MEDHVEMPERKRGGAWRKILIVFIVLIVLAAAAIGGGALYVKNALEPVEPSDQEVRVKIESGTGTSGIASQLEQQGLIRNATVFLGYLKWKGLGSKFKAGEYAMKPGMTIDDIVAMLNEGKTVKEETIRLTIPEGFTVKQMAEKVGEVPGWSTDKFLQIAESATGKYIADAYKQIPANKDIQHHLEGYLFPETYEFKNGSTEQDVVERMLQELDKRLTTLPGNWQDQLKTLGVSFHEMMTIASLVEREVAVDKERALVAGVIYNRIKEKMPLQIDATVQYLFEKPKERLLEKDLQIDSPYNTYKIPGIPPGPIGAPSIESIRAALYPETTKYLFYVTKKDGSKEHLFAETFAGHQKNIAESNKNQSK